MVVLNATRVLLVNYFEQGRYDESIQYTTEIDDSMIPVVLLLYMFRQLNLAAPLVLYS